MKPVKQSAVLAVLMSVVLVFTACGSTMIGSVEKTNKGSYSLQYKQFSGKKDVSFTVEEDETMVTIDVGTSSGILDIILRDKSDKDHEALYIDEKSVETTTIEGYLNKGDYVLEVRGDKHGGGFSIDY